MMLASALLKFNSRQQKHFIGNYKNTNTIYTAPIVLKKVTRAEQLKLNLLVKQLRHKEKIRYFLASFVSVIICIIAIIIMTKLVLG